MQNKLIIEHTSNAGLYIEIDGVSLLVDSIFQKDNDFDPLSEELEKEIFSKEGMYADVDCILFTHGHYDHYDYQMSRRYMEMFPETKIAAPECVFAVGGWTVLDFRSGRTIMFNENKDGFFKIKDITVFYYSSRHLDYGFSNFSFHYSFIIKKGDISIFISGDAQIEGKLISLLKNENTFNAAFFNPVVLYNNETRKVFDDIKAENKYIYHLPKKNNDIFKYRKTAEFFYNKHKDKLNNCKLLLGEIEEVLT